MVIQANTVAEAEEYINSIPRFTEKHEVGDTAQWLHRLGDPDRKLKIIHVAGTNGKGSVCAYLTAVLEAAGHSVCLFTSPHLVDIRERFRIRGELVSEEKFLWAFHKVCALIPEDRTGHPTYFEMLFLMGMLIFGESGCEYLVLETGLGGRLDATNSVSRKEISVITHMGLDHTMYLGDTIEQIAREKAGIMKADTPAVFYETDDTCLRVFTETAKQLQIPCSSVSKGDCLVRSVVNKSIDFSYQSLYYNIVELCLHTIALYQAENASLALRALEMLFPGGEITPEIMRKGLATAFWAGRMEEVAPDVYVDGAHNSDGIRAFLETVEMDGHTGGRRLLFAAVSDKDFETMTHEIGNSGLFTDVSVVHMKTARALSESVLLEAFVHTGMAIHVYEDVKTALGELLSQKKPDERIYIAGSLYLVGEIKELIDHDKL